MEKVVIRFVGDSGDGIQLIGNQIADTSVIGSRNDIYTFVDIPAEIKAPAGSLSGVSGFQLCISSEKVYLVEDRIDLLVAMNPAGLKTNIASLKDNGILLVDVDSFTFKNLNKAGYVDNPLLDGSLSSYNVFKVPITSLTCSCVSDIISVISMAKRCKNFFALGLVYWLYDRKLDNTIDWLSVKFKYKKDLFLANKKALAAGYNYGDMSEILVKQMFISPVKHNRKNKVYKKISGNKAFSLGILATSVVSGLPLFSANYPITPATDIWSSLSRYANSNINILQVEDEIASIMSIIGASYGGALSFTCTSGPGLDLMSEGLGLAVMSNLPVLLINVQRCGPATGIPTKSEQTDLLSSIFGRHGESDVVVLAANSPSDCFWTVIDGFYLSFKYKVPLIILSDTNLANSSESWYMPTYENINSFRDLSSLYKNYNVCSFMGTGVNKKLCCIGGLEKDINNNISYDSENHFSMVKKRRNKIFDIANDFMYTKIFGNTNGDVLMITWGSVYGIVKTIYSDLSKNKYNLSMVCLRYLHPLPKDLKSIMLSFKKILVIEENLGQLSYILKANYLLDIININQVSGKPFTLDDLKYRIIKNL